jgi:hypothetical protein
VNESSSDANPSVHVIDAGEPEAVRLTTVAGVDEEMLAPVFVAAATIDTIVVNAVAAESVSDHVPSAADVAVPVRFAGVVSVVVTVPVTATEAPDNGLPY